MVENKILYECLQLVTFGIDFRGHCIGHGSLRVILHFKVEEEVIETVLELKLMHNHGENSSQLSWDTEHPRNQWRTGGALSFDLCDLSTVSLCLETKGTLHETQRLGMAICYLCVRMRRKERWLWSVLLKSVHNVGLCGAEEEVKIIPKHRPLNLIVMFGSKYWLGAKCYFSGVFLIKRKIRKIVIRGSGKAYQKIFFKVREKVEHTGNSRPRWCAQ